jgi:hypothetical protein
MQGQIRQRQYNMQALKLQKANSTPDRKTNYMTESRYILDITAHWVASLKLRYSTKVTASLHPRAAQQHPRAQACW